MYLNTLKPAKGSKEAPTRLGRGIGSGKGKTCGKGHKGALARSGGGRRRGFEGGQMPLQRRVPKSGFRSRSAPFCAELSVGILEKFSDQELSLNVLKALGVLSHKIKTVKVIGNTELSKPLHIVSQGIVLSAGAKKSIEAAGGTIK